MQFNRRQSGQGKQFKRGGESAFPPERRGCAAMSPTILVTGAAGFIGSHTAQTLLARGDTVVGLDNLNEYYDPAGKQANLQELARSPGAAHFSFVRGDIRDRELGGRLCGQHEFVAVVHLAAMSGVRVSIENSHLYYDVNVNGTLTLVEAAREAQTPPLCLHRPPRPLAIPR